MSQSLASSTPCPRSLIGNSIVDSTGEATGPRFRNAASTASDGKVELPAGSITGTRLAEKNANWRSGKAAVDPLAVEDAKVSPTARDKSAGSAGEVIGWFTAS